MGRFRQILDRILHSPLPDDVDHELYHVIRHRYAKQRKPIAVLRGDETFGHDLRWRRAEGLTPQQVYAWGPWEAEQVERHEAAAAIEQIREDARCIDLAKWINTTYRYYAQGDEMVRGRLVDQHTVAYERFIGSDWAATETPTGELVEVDLDDVDEFKTAMAAGQPVAPEPPRPVPTRTAEPDGAEKKDYVVIERGHHQPLAIISTSDGEYVRTPTGDKWEPSDLVDQIAAGRYDWELREIGIKQFNDSFSAVSGSAFRAEQSAWLRREYKYYFCLRRQHDKTSVYGLLRRKRSNDDVNNQETLHADGQWHKTFYMSDAERGSGDDYMEVSDADVRRYLAGYYRRDR